METWMLVSHMSSFCKRTLNLNYIQTFIKIQTLVVLHVPDVSVFDIFFKYSFTKLEGKSSPACHLL